MAPFAADPMTTAPDLSVYDQTAADTCPHDDSKNHPRPWPFRADDPPVRLCQRKTVGIIGQDDRDTKPGRQIILQWPAVQDDSIAIFHYAECWVEDPRRSETNGVGLQPRSLLHFPD